MQRLVIIFSFLIVLNLLNDAIMFLQQNIFSRIGIIVMDHELASQQVWGQPGTRLPIKVESKQEKIPRLPNDEIEGTIWEYKCRPKIDGAKEKQEIEFEGKFRLEEGAVFSVNDKLQIIPPKDEVANKIKDFKDGKGLELKGEQSPQRIGEFKKLSSGKTRLDFNQTGGMNGIMIIWLKEGTKDVWMGTFSKVIDKKTKKEYLVELRPIQD